MAAFADENVSWNVPEANAVAGTAFNILEGVTAASQDKSDIDVGVSDVTSADEKYTWNGTDMTITPEEAGEYVITYNAVSTVEGVILDTYNRTVTVEPAVEEQGEPEGSSEEALSEEGTEETVEAESTEATEPVESEVAASNKSTASGLTRTLGTDKTDDFKIDSFTVSISGEVVNPDGSTSSYKDVVYKYGEAPVQTSLDMYSNPKVTVDMSWSQVNINQDYFVAGDYILFELCKISGCEPANWSNFTEIALMYGGVKLGTGKLIAEETGTDETTLYFKVTFTENIVDRYDIKGSMTVGADIKGLTKGDEIVFSSFYDMESDFADITIVEKPNSGVGTVPGGNGQPLYLHKAALNYSSSTNTIRWRIFVHSPELIKAGFKAYADGAYTAGGKIGNYDNIIIEETIDEHQSFYNSAGDLEVELRMPFWLYDSENYMTNSSTYSYGNLSAKLMGHLTKITGGSNAEIEATVKTTARSYAVITEQHPDNPSVMRERLIMNLGAFGDTGLRYGELMPGAATQYGSLGYWLNQLVKYQGICEAVIAANPGASDNETISYYSTSEQLTYTNTMARWKLLERLYRESYDYYNIKDGSGNLIGPYVSGFEFDVVTRVLTENIDTLLTESVKNSVSVSGVLIEYEKGATQDNIWSADISAMVAEKGEIQIFKADSLYGNEAGDKTDASSISGAMGSVSFQVYESGNPNPLTFNLSNEGKYVYNSNGSYTEVTTYSANGSIILSGLKVDKTYYLKEYGAPDGYYTGQNQEIGFSVDSDSVAYKLVNNDARGVTLTKVDADDRAPLAAAAFRLYKYNDKTGDYEELTGFKATTINGAEYLVYNRTGTAQLTTGSDGKLSIVQLPAGKYYLEEALAPNGYQLSDTKYEFVLSESLETEKDAIVDLGEIENALISTSMTLEGTKELSGRSLKAGEFHFVVTDKDNEEVATGTNDAEGKITFEAIEYTWKDIGKTYTYTIKEIIGEAGGVTYDDTEYTVNVTVADNADGTLTATPSYPDDGIKFKNAYSTGSTTVTLEGTKNLAGKELTDDMFSFAVYDENGEIVSTGTNKADGSITFSEIILSSAGIYNYTVSEVDSGAGGITYDGTEYAITVEVADNGDGILSATVNSPESGLVFNNEYTTDSAAVSFTGTKNLTGKSLEAGVFSFVVKDADEEIVATGTNEADGTIVFDEIGFTKPGTYTYTVSELNSGAGGIAYDEIEYTVTVEVEDKGDGTLSATVNYPESGLVFNNKYTTDSISVTLEGTKNLAGKELTDDMFSFAVYDENGEIVSTGTNKADGSITFSEIILPSAGSYNYTVSEVDGGAGGIIYDGTEYAITVEVEDNGDGTLGATVNSPESGLVFNNEYTTDSAAVSFMGSKNLTGKSLEAGMFSFVVKDVDEEIVATGTNEADGTIVFGEIGFTNPGTYTYTVSELDSGAGGIAYDEIEYTVTVEVVDNGDGTLSATVNYPESGLVFNNKYTTDSISVTLEGTKNLAGKELTDNMFSFIVKSENGDIASTGSNKADGSIVFGDISFSSPGTYTYTVSEVNGGAGGIIYDETEYAVTVEVKDNGNGTLSATVSYPESGLVFNNEYTTGDPPVAFTGTKKLTGKELTDDMFSFVVKDKDGKIVSTGTNKADGTIAFSEIGFNNPGVYTFAVSEVNGNAVGITYDETEYTGVVTVVDNGEGTLTAEVSYPDGKIEFHNSYNGGSTDANKHNNNKTSTSGTSKTGDESMSYWWFIVLFVSAFLTGILLWNNKKKT